MSNSKLWKALIEASSGIAYLEEDGRAEYGGGGYDYISAPGAVRALKPALISVGLLPTVTGCKIIEVAGKQVAELQCRLVHIESGEEMRDVFALPTAPGRGRDEGKAAQAAITSGLGRWLRCLLLAVQAGEDEIDTSRPTSARKPDPLQKPQGAEEGQMAAMAQAVGVKVDDLAMWATRKGDKAQVGTLDTAIKRGLVSGAVERLKEDFEKAKSQGMTLRQFGDQVVSPWASNQIPF